MTTTAALFWLSQHQWRVLQQVLPTGRGTPSTYRAIRNQS
jgi:hypothetical protein